MPYIVTAVLRSYTVPEERVTVTRFPTGYTHAERIANQINDKPDHPFYADAKIEPAR